LQASGHPPMKHGACRPVGIRIGGQTIKFNTRVGHLSVS
jgi:hypothetical protein